MLGDVVGLRGASLAPRGEMARGICRIQIKAEHYLAQLLQCANAGGFPIFHPTVGFAKQDAFLRPDLFIVTRTFNLKQRSAGIDLYVRHGHDFPDFAGKRRDHLRLHLHGLEDGQAVSDFHGIAGFNGDRNNHRRGGSVHHASVVAIYLVSYAIHLNSRTDALTNRNNMESSSEDTEPTFILVQTIDVGFDPDAIDLDAVIFRTEAVRLHGIEPPVIAQSEDTADLAPDLGAPAGRGCIELGLL